MPGEDESGRGRICWRWWASYRGGRDCVLQSVPLARKRGIRYVAGCLRRTGLCVGCVCAPGGARQALRTLAADPDRPREADAYASARTAAVIRVLRTCFSRHTSRDSDTCAAREWRRIAGECIRECKPCETLSRFRCGKLVLVTVTLERGRPYHGTV